MSDQPVPATPTNSYVDSYSPPTGGSASPMMPTPVSDSEPMTSGAAMPTAMGSSMPNATAPTPTPAPAATPATPAWTPTAKPVDVADMKPMTTPAVPPVQNPASALMPDHSTSQSSTPTQSSSATAPAPTPATSVSAAAPTEPTKTETTSAVSQALEDQNIFHLLGVIEATDEEKEAFLDELQQVIWEDFLENDVELLLTETEMADLKKIMDKKDVNDLEQQEEIVTYLEKLVPDLEEIMLEKALELKADMVTERISGMRQYFDKQTEKLAVLDKAESLIAADQWREAAETLNSLT